MARRPRIVITIVTETSTTETSIVRGREMANGEPSPGPTEEQFKIAQKAARDLLLASRST